MLLIKKGTVITPDVIFDGDVLIDGEKIVEIGSTIKKKNVKTIDAKGKLVFPGGIDTSTHISQMKGPFECVDSFKDATMKGAIGGTTTILNYVFPIRGSYKKAINENLKKAENNSAVDYSFHLAITNYSERGINELENIVSMGITSFICYYGTSGMYLSLGELYSIFKAVKKSGGIVGVFTGNGSILEKRSKEGLKEGKKGIELFLYSYPEDIEGLTSYSILSLAKKIDVPIFLINTSSIDTLEKIKLFKDFGLKVYSDTPLHYLLFSKNRYEKSDFLKYVTIPPLKSEKHIEYLWQGIKSGDLDLISSDHIFVNEENQKKILEETPQKLYGGIPGIRNRIETLFSEGVLKRKLSLNEFVKLISTNGAKIFGLYPKKGVIAPGSDADIVILNPETEWTLKDDSIYKNSPYKNMKIKGKIEKVILRGEIIVDGDKYISKELKGKFIPRNREQ